MKTEMYHARSWAMRLVVSVFVGVVLMLIFDVADARVDKARGSMQFLVGSGVVNSSGSEAWQLGYEWPSESWQRQGEHVKAFVMGWDGDNDPITVLGTQTRRVCRYGDRYCSTVTETVIVDEISSANTAAGVAYCKDWRPRKVKLGGCAGIARTDHKTTANLDSSYPFYFEARTKLVTGRKWIFTASVAHLSDVFKHGDDGETFIMLGTQRFLRW